MMTTKRTIACLSRLFLGSIFALCATGCASTHMMAQSHLPVVTSTTPALITVHRSGSWVAGALPIAVYDNGKLIGELGPSGTMTWKRDPGPLRLRVRGVQRCGGGLSGQQCIDLDDVLKANDSKSYRCGLLSPFNSIMIFLTHDFCTMPEEHVTASPMMSQGQPAKQEQQPVKESVPPLQFASKIVEQWPKLQVGQSMKDVKAIVSAIDDEFARTMSLAMLSMEAGYSMSDSNFRHVYQFADPSAIQVLVSAGLVSSQPGNQCTVEMKLMFDDAGKLKDWTPKSATK